MLGIRAVNHVPRLHDRLLWALLLLVSLCVVAWAFAAAFPTNRPDATPRTPLGEVAPFALTERSGRVVTHRDLEGKTWIAAATFNCCTMSCPQIRAVFRELQDALRHTGVILVSISVDPEEDTPELARTRWSLLGGLLAWEVEKGRGELRLLWFLRL